MTTSETKFLIKQAINDPEFIEKMAESFDYLDVIKKAYETDNIIVLQALVKTLQKRIDDLNIMFWFIRINSVIENIVKKGG